MVQTLAEKKKLLKAGWFFAHRENGRIVTDQDELRMHLGGFNFNGKIGKIKIRKTK